MAIISLLLLFEYRINPKNDKESLIQKNKEEKYENIGDNNIEIKGSKIQEKDKYKYEKEEVRISLKEAFIQAIKGIQIYQLLIMSTFLQIVCFTISNTYRSFAQQCLMEEYFLSNLNRLYSILSGISRLIWGYLFDKFNFKSLYSICIITQAIVDSILYNSVHYPILFFFLVCFQGVLVSGKISLNATMFKKYMG